MALNNYSLISLPLWLWIFWSCFIAVQTLKEYSHLSSKLRRLSVTAHPPKLSVDWLCIKYPSISMAKAHVSRNTPILSWLKDKGCYYLSKLNLGKIWLNWKSSWTFHKRILMMLNCFGMDKLHGFVMYSVMLAVSHISNYNFKYW